MNKTNKMDKHRFNILDIIIILAVICALTFAVNIIINDLLANDMENIEYVIKLTDVASDDINDITVGDKIISGTNNALVGKVIEVNSNPKITYAFNYETDRFVAVEHSNKFNVLLTVSAVSSNKNNMFVVNNNIISANRNIEISVPFFYEDAIITNVVITTDTKTEQEVNH